MHSFSRFILPPLAALTLTVSLSAAGWAHGTVVNVSLWDKGANVEMADGLGMGMAGAHMSKATMGIKVSMKSVKAGEVTFRVTNDSKDTVHEMVVSPIKGMDDPLPYSADENEVDEDAAGNLSEVSELDPGKSGSLTLHLKPGKYILYCNVPGHYMSGMWTMLSVN